VALGRWLLTGQGRSSHLLPGPTIGLRHNAGGSLTLRRDLAEPPSVYQMDDTAPAGKAHKVSSDPSVGRPYRPTSPVGTIERDDLINYLHGTVMCTGRRIRGHSPPGALLSTSDGTQPHPQKNRKSHPNIIN
jgi:hypothetical protein